jgi:ATP-dependent helicase/nuclease subunit B
MQNIDNVAQLLEKISQKHIVLTPNKRLSLILEQKYAESFANQVIEKPAIMPYKHYLLLNYQTLSQEYSLPILLNDHQSYELWHQTLADNSDYFNLDGLISDVQKSWGNCSQWLLNIDKQSFNYSHETRQFYQWVQSYKDKLDSLGAIDDCLVYSQIKTHLITGTTPLIFAFFDELTPEQQELIDKKQDSGTPVYSYDMPTQNNKVSCYIAEESSVELNAVIDWTKQKLGQGIDNIGIVIPDLSQNHQRLTRHLNQHFSQEEYNISMGKTLASYPIISQAFSLLSINPQKLTNREIRLLLTSPFIGESESEFLKRSECFNHLELLKEPSLSLSKLIKALEPHCPKLVKRLNALTSDNKKLLLSPEQWSNRFKSSLNSLAYPGEQGLSSYHYQCFKRFELLFDEFSQLNLVSKKLSFSKALNLLKRLADKTIFQPQSKQEPIQILGLLEASGLEFDALWVMGMTDTCLPASPKLSPFIPYQLQKKYSMPHSSAEKELAYASRQVKRLAASSPECIFSYAKLNADEESQASPLITHFPVSEIKLKAKTDNKKTNIEQFKDLEVLEIGADEVLRGGTFIIKDQALCPFRAFARHRLKAEPIISEVTGLDPLDRGLLIHKVLELVWQELKTQARLLTIDEQQLREIIQSAIEEALHPLLSARPTTMNETFQSLEKDRLFKLTNQWLALEKERPSFEVIATEEWQQLNLAGLVINMRADRIDRLTNGEKWVIDYKTGSPSTNEWFDERCGEPQLPIYSLTEEEITGLVFAQLKTGDLRFKGIAQNPHEINGIADVSKKAQSWDEQRALWHEQMTLLAEEFLSGNIIANPKKPSVCQNCEFSNLCRIHH